MYRQKARCVARLFIPLGKSKRGYSMHKKSLVYLLMTAALVFAQGPLGRPGGPGRGSGPMSRGGGPGGGGPGGGGPGAQVVTGAPFSAVEVRQFQEQLADGNTISQTSQTTLYRDSQGRTRTEATVTPPAASGKQPYTMITITDPVAGLEYRLDSSTMHSHTSRIPVYNATVAAAAATRRAAAGASRTSTSGSATAAVRTGRAGSQIVTAELGSQLKNGALATGKRETEVIAAGAVGNAQPMTVVRETWYSEQLKRNVLVRVTDPERGNSTTELTNLLAGEPSSALFTLPAGYTETGGGRGPSGGWGGSGGRGPGGPGGGRGPGFGPGGPGGPSGGRRGFGPRGPGGFSGGRFRPAPAQ